jgi:hypothetical protein
MNLISASLVPLNIFMKFIPTPVHPEPNLPRFTMRAWFVALVLVFGGCTNRAHFETSGGGHKIFASVEGGHSIESRATHAAITSQFGEVMIERDRARIDQGRWEKIPENVPVKTSISKHTVSIRAGAVTISRTMR